MRNLSYMGRLVVKLIIIAIIAFVVITTAVFVINKYKKDKTAEEAENKVAITQQEGSKDSATQKETNKKDNEGATVLPGDTSGGVVDTNKSTKDKPSSSSTAASSAESSLAPAGSTGLLPQTGPADTLLKVVGFGSLVFAIALYFSSRKI